MPSVTSIDNAPNQKPGEWPETGHSDVETSTVHGHAWACMNLQQDVKGQCRLAQILTSSTR
jgi:hypothetical protein